MFKRDNVIINKFLVNREEKFFQWFMRSIIEESIELGCIGERAHREATHMRESGMGIKEINKSWDGFNLFKVFNYESSKHSMSGITGATDRIVFIRDRREVKGLEESIILTIKF
jgi:hypothetical protein